MFLYALAPAFRFLALLTAFVWSAGVLELFARGLQEMMTFELRLQKLEARNLLGMGFKSAS